MSFPKKKSGLAMAEALMAVALLAAGAVILSTITTNATSSMQVSRNYLIAQNLVSEALEVVKTVQATNAMRYPDDRSCWLTLASSTGSSSCGTDQAAEGRYYLVVDVSSGGWTLVDSGNTPGLELEIDGDVSVQNKYRMYLENGLYAQDPGILSNPTKYYRSVDFSNITADSVLVEVKIQWKEGQKVYTISGDTVFYNYQ